MAGILENITTWQQILFEQIQILVFSFAFCMNVMF